uniref:Uncharacterized protein n=1 Tax=Dulem virus 87 TaxID=3145798 RepID=A0AAU8B4N3_9VIRU
MVTKFRTQYNYEPFEDINIGVDIDSKSKTIPDLSFSVRQILNDFTIGLTRNYNEHEVYYDDDLPEDDKLTDDDFERYSPSDTGDTDLSDIASAGDYIRSVQAYQNEKRASKDKQVLQEPKQSVDTGE